MQTAVEWLAEIVCKMGYVSSNIVEQAKQMEKQQIMDAANTLLYHSTGPGNTAAEQYYNETFKKD